MAVPDFQTIMLPLLKLAGDNQTHSVKECVAFIEQEFHLTDEEKLEKVPSGKQRTVYNRVTWAITHIKKAGLIAYREKRGSFGITESGQKLLAQSPAGITVKLLRNYESYRSFVDGGSGAEATPVVSSVSEETRTPEEIMGSLAEQLNLQLADELLDVIYGNTPSFFENLVVDLLVKMGYGGLDGKGIVTKKSRDGGIDGIITQDELGLESIYIQAKRWDRGASVSRPEIQKFAGALLGEGATKGIFIATASFSKGAVEYARTVPNAKIILIDGTRLAQFMIKHDLGVSTSNVIHIKKIDSDYFEEQ
jgi:restriction system protein